MALPKCDMTKRYKQTQSVKQGKASKELRLEENSETGSRRKATNNKFSFILLSLSFGQ